MKAIVVYDTMFGNTEKVAKGIAAILKADVYAASDVDTTKLKDYGVFVFGSPTHAWNMSSKMKQLFKQLENQTFHGKKAATFDTKLASRFAGSAAQKIEKKLKHLGFSIVMEPVNFVVLGREGPLADGEMEKTKVFSKVKGSD